MHAMEPLELEGDMVRLQPLRTDHAGPLLAAIDSEEVFEWLPYGRPEDLEQAEAWVRKALADQMAGRRLPFAISDVATGTVIGSTSFWDADGTTTGVEIGSTWFRRASWGDGSNLETKLLLMTHAFETLGLERVSFRTDILNERSRAALERLGSVQEGIHRHEMRRQDGTWRDSVHYSVLSSEWPDAKRRLADRLRAKRGA